MNYIFKYKKSTFCVFPSEWNEFITFIPYSYHNAKSVGKYGNTKKSRCEYVNLDPINIWNVWNVRSIQTSVNWCTSMCSIAKIVKYTFYDKYPKEIRIDACEKVRILNLFNRDILTQLFIKCSNFDPNSIQISENLRKIHRIEQFVIKISTLWTYSQIVTLDIHVMTVHWTFS